jgi:hypothetical protein
MQYAPGHGVLLSLEGASGKPSDVAYVALQAVGAGFPSHMSVVDDGPMNTTVNKTATGCKIQVS